MDTYVELEMLPEHTCLQCGLHGGTEKKVAITSAPHVFMLHISRFDTGLQKIHKYVEFPQHLTTDHIRSGNGQSLDYRLRRLIVNVGLSIAKGHNIPYTVINENWYKTDDRTATRISWQRVSTLQAYILLYEI